MNYVYYNICIFLGKGSALKRDFTHSSYYLNVIHNEFPQ